MVVGLVLATGSEGGSTAAGEVGNAVRARGDMIYCSTAMYHMIAFSQIFTQSPVKDAISPGIVWGCQTTVEIWPDEWPWGWGVVSELSASIILLLADDTK